MWGARSGRCPISRLPHHCQPERMVDMIASLTAASVVPPLLPPLSFPRSPCASLLRDSVSSERVPTADKRLCAIDQYGRQQGLPGQHHGPRQHRRRQVSLQLFPPSRLSCPLSSLPPHLLSSAQLCYPGAMLTSILFHSGTGESVTPSSTSRPTRPSPSPSRRPTCAP